MSDIQSPSRQRGIGTIAHLFLSQSSAKPDILRKPPQIEQEDVGPIEPPPSPPQMASCVAAFHLTDPSAVLRWWRDHVDEQGTYRFIGSEQQLAENPEVPLTVLCTARDEDIIATYQLIKRIVLRNVRQQAPAVCVCENNENEEVFQRLNKACERYLNISCRMHDCSAKEAEEIPAPDEQLQLEELADLCGRRAFVDCPPPKKHPGVPAAKMSLPPIHQTIPIETFPEDDIWLTRLLSEQAVLWLAELQGPVSLDIRLPDRLDERGRVLVDGRGRLWGILASLGEDSQLLVPGITLRHWIHEHAGLLADACRGVYIDAAQSPGLILATATNDRILEDIAVETHTGDILTRRIHFLTRGLAKALLIV